MDLMAYEAQISARTGDLARAEQLLDQIGDVGQHPVADLVKAEIYLTRKQFEEAEVLLSSLIGKIH